jgi:hypothetical protein
VNPGMSTSSGATRLRPVARLRDAGGSWWPLKPVQMGAFAILADGQECDRGRHWRGDGSQRESRQGNRTAAGATDVANDGLRFSGGIPAHIGMAVVCLRVMVRLTVRMHVGDGLVVMMSGGLVHVLR